MLRFVTIFVFILLFGVSAGLYHVKYSVDRMERQGLSLKAKIADEQEAIRILDAEWSALNRPGRLQKLSERFQHELAPVQAAQVVNFAAIPERPAADDSAPLTADSGQGAAERNKQLTSAACQITSGNCPLSAELR